MRLPMSMAKAKTDFRHGVRLVEITNVPAHVSPKGKDE